MLPRNGTLERMEGMDARLILRSGGGEGEARGAFLTFQPGPPIDRK